MINQYTITGNVIVDGRIEKKEPLTEVCSIDCEGESYETFHCSGALGGLLEVCSGKVHNLSFRSMHHKGHCENMRFLLHDLQMKDDRALLEQVLNKAIVSDAPDKVVISIRAKGQVQGYAKEKSYQRTLRPATIEGIPMSATQASSVVGASVIVDMVLQQAEEYRGLIFQERIGLRTFLANRFASYYV